MFKSYKRQRERIATLEARIATLEATLADLIQASDQLQKRAMLVEIRRDGRSNTFVFVRDGKLHQIETMGLISDNPAQWRKDLIE